jgi:hypothetical protein
MHMPIPETETAPSTSPVKTPLAIALVTMIPPIDIPTTLMSGEVVKEVKRV